MIVPKKRRGFTFLDTWLAITITMIVLALGIMNYSSSRANNAVTVSQQVIAAALRLAKDQASQGTCSTATPPVCATINMSAAVLSGTGITIKNGTGATVWQQSLPKGVTITTAWGNTTLSFQQNGTPSQSGAVTIGNTTTTYTKQVLIDSFSGAANVQ